MPKRLAFFPAPLFVPVLVIIGSNGRFVSRIGNTNSRYMHTIWLGNWVSRTFTPTKAQRATFPSTRYSDDVFNSPFSS